MSDPLCVINKQLQSTTPGPFLNLQENVLTVKLPFNRVKRPINVFIKFFLLMSYLKHINVHI